MNKELPKVYEPQEVESRVYQSWEENGCFQGVRDPEKKPFTIVMPPPNVTGQLHIGHAMDDAMQDMLIRYKRMQGYAALYLPGTDHAGIATQIKVEEELRKNEGLTSRRSWAYPPTGSAPASPWTRGCPRRCATCSSPCMRRA